MNARTRRQDSRLIAAEALFLFAPISTFAAAPIAIPDSSRQVPNPLASSMCSIQGGNNSQPPEPNCDYGSMSSPSIGSAGVVQADDFVPQFFTLSQVCVWGKYSNLEHGMPPDCAANVVADNFIVRILEDFDGLPCGIAGESAATSVRADVGTVCGEPEDPATFVHTLTLQSPISGLDASGHTIYWLEVSNDVQSNSGTCMWFWDKQGTNSQYGNHYSLSGSIFGYPQGSERTDDFTWCLNGDVIPHASGELIRNCCDCAAGTCTLATLKDCHAANSIWDVDNQTVSCGSCVHGGPPNDHCPLTLGNFVQDGTYSFNTQCADTDGPSTPNSTEGSVSAPMAADVWYRYQAPYDCTLTVSMCSAGTAFNSMLAVYHKLGDCNFCPTDSNDGNQFLVNGHYEDESCTGVSVGGAGLSVSQAQAGECYVIRAGGFGDFRGSGTVQFSCVPPNRATCMHLFPCPRCASCAVPELALDSDGMNKSRYISFQVPITYGDTEFVSAIAVKLASLMHPQPPNLPQFPPHDFSAFEHQVRWIGPPADCVESENGGTTFKCSTLQCAPAYIDWISALHCKVLYVTGSEIMPSSIYEIRQYAPSCEGSEFNCTAVSSPLLFTTQRSGDIVAPFQDTSLGAVLTQPNITDVAAVVDKFKDVPTAPILARCDVAPNVPNSRVGITDVAVTVDAFKNLAYEFAGPATCP